MLWDIHLKADLIPISLNYYPLVVARIIQGCITLNANSQLLLNRTP